MDSVLSSVFNCCLVCLLVLGAGGWGVSGFNIPRNLKNCSDCHRALEKDVDQLRRLQRIRNRISTALGPGRIKGKGKGIQLDEGSPKPLMTTPKEERDPEQAEKDIYTYPAKIDRRDESSLLEFLIVSKPVGGMEVVSADLWVRVKKRGRNRRGKRIVLKVFQQKNGGDGENDLLTYLRTKVKKTRWQRLSLPISLIQNIVAPSDQGGQPKLQLRIDCRRCGRAVKLVLPKGKHKRKHKKKRFKGLRELKTPRVVQKRPFLHIHTRVKVHSDATPS